jgi:hypothetical protein
MKLSAILDVWPWRAGRGNTGEPVIFVVSYPRSGNTMVVRTLARLLDAKSFTAMPGKQRRFDRAKGDAEASRVRIVKDHVPRLDYRRDRCIFVIRDGRDSVISLAYMVRERYPITLASELADFIRWAHDNYNLGSWATHMRKVQRLRSHPGKLLVRYEDLLSESGAEFFQEVVDFAIPGHGLDRDVVAAAYADKDQVLANIGSKPKANKYWGLGIEFPPESIFYEWSKNRQLSSWRQIWPSDAKRAFHETGATEYLMMHGYETDADWWRD